MVSVWRSLKFVVWERVKYMVVKGEIAVRQDAVVSLLPHNAPDPFKNNSIMEDEFNA